VTINGQGFGAYTQEKVVVAVAELPRSGQLSVGPQSESNVTVTSEAPGYQYQQQDFSSNLNQTSINELPVNGRSWSNFALLRRHSADGNFGLISFRGISGLLNNNTIDGGDKNQAFFRRRRGRTRISYSISQAAISANFR